MKKSILPALLLLAIFAFPQNAKSIVGLPWDFNTADGNQANGVHSAAFSGKNMTGVSLLNVTGESSSGSFIVFREGVIIAGNAFTIFNTSAKEVSGIFEGAAPLITISFDESDGLVINNTSEVYGIPVIAADTVEVIRIPSTAGGAFQGSITSTGPEFTWEGEGEFSFTVSDGSGGTDLELVDFSIHGVRTSFTLPVQNGFFNTQVSGVTTQ